MWRRLMTLPLRLKPYTTIFHGVLICALLIGMGYAVFPPRSSQETTVRLTAFFILLALQSFLWMMRERAFKEAQVDNTELKKLNAELIKTRPIPLSQSDRVDDREEQENG